MANVVRFQIRGDTAENWENANPVLLLNELGYDQTANRLKVGNGIRAWNELPYIEPNNAELMMNFMSIDGRTVSKYVYVDGGASSGGGDDPDPTPTPNPNPEPAPVIDFSSAHWERIEMPTTMIGARNFVDYGTEVGKVLFTDSRWSYIYDIATGQCEDFYNYIPINSDYDNPEDVLEEEEPEEADTYYQDYPIIGKTDLSLFIDIDPVGKGVLRRRDFFRSGLDTEFVSPLKEASNLPAINYANNGDCYIGYRGIVWYPKKKCFIVAADMYYFLSSSSSFYYYPYTYLVTPDGEVFTRYTTKGSNYGSMSTKCGIVYSSSRDELIGVSEPSISIRKSIDGLNWTRHIPSGLLQKSTENPVGLCRSEQLGVYILATYYSTSGDQKGIHVYKSEDGISWEHVYFFPYSTYQTKDVAMANNDELGVISLVFGCSFGASSSKVRPVGYLTQDLENWTEVDSGEEYTGIRPTKYTGLKWSPSLQSFVCCVFSSANRNPMKLVITR